MSFSSAPRHALLGKNDTLASRYHARLCFVLAAPPPPPPRYRLSWSSLSSVWERHRWVSTRRRSSPRRCVSFMLSLFRLWRLCPLFSFSAPLLLGPFSETAWLRNVVATPVVRVTHSLAHSNALVVEYSMFEYAPNLGSHGSFYLEPFAVSSTSFRVHLFILSLCLFLCLPLSLSASLPPSLSISITRRPGDGYPYHTRKYTSRCDILCVNNLMTWYLDVRAG